MAHTQGSSHCQVIPQSVRPPLLEPRSCARFHHRPHVLHQLAHTWSNFSSSNSNNHALRLIGRSAGRHRLACRAIVCAFMSALLRPSSCHCCCVVCFLEKSRQKAVKQRIWFFSGVLLRFSQLRSSILAAIDKKKSEPRCDNKFKTVQPPTYTQHVVNEEEEAQY